MLDDIYSDMSADEAFYKDKLDTVWAELCTDAGPGAETELLTMLDYLQQNKEGEVAQDGNIQSASHLIEISHRINERVQSVLKSLADACGAEYVGHPHWNRYPTPEQTTLQHYTTSTQLHYGIHCIPPYPAVPWTTAA